MLFVLFTIFHLQFTICCQYFNTLVAFLSFPFLSKDSASCTFLAVDLLKISITYKIIIASRIYFFKHSFRMSLQHNLELFKTWLIFILDQTSLNFRLHDFLYYVCPLFVLLLSPRKTVSISYALQLLSIFLFT